MKTLIFYTALIPLIIVGWIMNLVTIFNTAHVELTGMFILRIVGIFVAPIGGVLGYF
jgi:hypothetical protein